MYTIYKIKMFFNSDSMPLIVTGIIVGSLFTYTIYNIFTTSIQSNESLINTNSSLNSISKLDSNIQNLPNNSYTDVGIQTETNIQIEAGIQAQNTYTNTGMQTSSRMWLESIRNWIDEILSRPSNLNPNYVDVGVQTDANVTLMWQTVKQWFLEVLSVRSSELSSIGIDRIYNWRNKLPSNQSIDLHDSESPLTILKFGNDTELDQLLDPNDSASNISEVIFEGSQSTNVQAVNTANNVVNRVYDMSNRQDVLDLINDPTVALGINSAYDTADDIITFITPDTSYDIVRSTLETLLNSVN